MENGFYYDIKMRRKVNQAVEKVKIGGLPKPRYERKKM
jgi:hypothetical protein